MSRQRREVQPHLVPLGAALRRAREAVRPPLSGNRMAANLGWGQTKVSLIETGRQTPTEDDVTAWAGATGADPAELLDARESALVRRLDIRAAARRPGGANVLQGDLATLEAASSTITEYQPTVIPGLAQTPAYTRAWLNQSARVDLGDPLDAAGVEDVIARRVARQRAAAGKRIVAAVPDWVLTAVYGTPATQRAQLNALITSVTAGTLDLIVVRRPLALLHGFELLDDAAIVETVADVSVMAHAEVVARFRAAMTQARHAGVKPDRVVGALERARDSL